jgi:hypothetical protein
MRDGSVSNCKKLVLCIHLIIEDRLGDVRNLEKGLLLASFDVPLLFYLEVVGQTFLVCVICVYFKTHPFQICRVKLDQLQKAVSLL